jgi:hypothetical protein
MVKKKNYTERGYAKNTLLHFFHLCGGFLFIPRRCREIGEKPHPALHVVECNTRALNTFINWA